MAPVWGHESSDIEVKHTNGFQQSNCIYDLKGRCVNNKLLPGIYIQQSHKQVVR
jgi:hypothetical protein